MIITENNANVNIFQIISMVKTAHQAYPHIIKNFPFWTLIIIGNYPFPRKICVQIRIIQYTRYNSSKGRIGRSFHLPMLAYPDLSASNS